MVSTGDEISSKRVIALVAFILMAISYTYGIITDTKIPEYMWEGFLFIVLAAFFGNVVEKFRRKNENY
jgi:VIT1/CCC1 family predicted Fe2+/Mn2+ transporter